MSIKSILVHVDNTPRAQARIEVARVVAERHDAHLTGMFTAGSLEVPAYLRAELGEVYMQRRAEALMERRKAAESTFLKHAAGLRPSRLDFRAIDGDPVQAMAGPARYADLIVVGQHESPAPEGSVVSASFPEDLVLATGRPALVVPYAGQFSGSFDHPMIAWKPSRESVRAVTDAIPLLAKARRVTVVSVDSRHGSHTGPGADLAVYLARHDVAVEVVHDPSGTSDIGSTLLNRVFEHECDLLVMGCYGHSRLREMTLGGVSRTILSSMTVPVLLAH